MNGHGQSEDKGNAHRLGQEGFTIPELLVAAAVVVVMIGAIVPVIWISSGNFGGQSDRVSALDNDRVAFDEMTRALRQARLVVPVPADAPGPSVQHVAVTTNSGGQVEFDCGVPSEIEGRFKCISRSAGGSKDLIDGITNTDPFAITGDRYVAVNLQKSPPGAEHPVSLQGGVSLRLNSAGSG